ncbi:MAG: hypothetical protein DRP12_00565 [Candidatus Aenigmatarchaeota archaeon]|nr:MAG: hypothetical protein DRP12_00565 [Candidatus Aenigmarchaeota archaeon]
MKREEIPITSLLDMVDGWISGSLVSAGILSDYGLIFQLILFGFGLWIYLRNLFPYEKPIYTLTLTVFLVIGIFAYWIFKLVRMDIPYVCLCLLLFFGLWLRKRRLRR